MLNRRPTILALTFAVLVSIASHCDAGEYADWLYGKTQPVYASGYAPYYAGYAPAPAAPAQTTPIAIGGSANAVALNGAYQVQRPVYDNPSVYTGMPVALGTYQTSYRMPVNNANPFATAYRPVVGVNNPVVPLGRRLRGAASATSNPFYGTGNIYPNNLQVPTAAGLQIGGSAISAAPPSLGPITTGPVTTFRAPITTPIPNTTPLPSTTATTTLPTIVTPVTAPRRRPILGGLARFFGSLWGTNYQTSYYRAPITYYRPVTSVDPILGTTVTVQQPCSSYVQQLQRTPYNSLFAAQSQPLTFQNNGFANPSCGSVPLAASPYVSPPTNTLPLTGAPQSRTIGQVGGVTSPSDQYVTPIPSTIPQNNSGFNTQPLQGAPSASQPSDLQPMPQPRLETTRPNWQEEDNTKLDSYWDLQNQDDTDKTAFQSIPRGVFSASTPENTASELEALRPIEAPADLQSPFTRQTYQTAKPEFNATDYLEEARRVRSPESLLDSVRSRTPSRVTVPVREATASSKSLPKLPTSTRTKSPVQRANHWE